MRSWKNACVAGLCVALAGCGGAQHPTSTAEVAEIDRIRAEAAAHPSDPAAQRALAEWELLGDGGDAGRAAAAIAHAEELSPSDVGLAYLHAVLAEQHGHADEALGAFLAVIEGARTSDDPLAPAYAESSLAYIHDLETDAPRFDERVRPVIEALFASPGHVGFPVRRQAFLWLRDLARHRGDTAEIARLEAAMGSPTQARVAGPFGFTVVMGFDTTLPAEGRGPMADRYDLGPGRGAQPTRSVDAEHGTLSLSGGEPEQRGHGTRVVEATLHAGEAGHYVLALDATGSVQISVDGAQIARIDRRREDYPHTIFQPLDLSAGDHELELKIASRSSSPSVGWTLDRASEGYAPEAGLALPDAPEGPLARFVVIDVRSDRGETVAAREALRPLVGDTSSATLLALAARVASIDPYVPETQRNDDERRLVALAAQRDPEAYWPAVREAALTSGDVEMLAAQRAVADRFPEMASVQLGLAATLSSAGYVADADRAIARAEALRPEACAVISARLSSLASRGRFDAIQALADRLVACNAQDGTRFDLAVNRRDWDAARAELTRLSPFLTAGARRELELRIARGVGDHDAETRLEAEAEAEAIAGQGVIRTADRAYLRGARAEALAALDAEAARVPRRAGDLRSLAFALSGHDVMEPWRVNGLDVVRRFEASGRSYEGHAAVLVFDYMVTRVFPDGSALDLVHQIFRVQTAEGVERFGSMSLSGRVLTVRAIGADGTTREPDHIASSTDMPPLEVGDYVEYELVREHAPDLGDAYASDGWVFQDFTQPFDHSEMVFVAPLDMPLHFDARGPVPAPATHDENGLRTYRFVIEQSQPLVREPNYVADPPVIPSLRAATGVTWERMYQSVYDGLLGGDVVDPAARRTLEDEILERHADLPARERIQRIHRWVMENVDAADNTFFASAPLMLAAHRGNRVRVLRYLLELAGLPARILLARELAGQRPSDEVPDSNVYSADLVEVRLPEGPLYLAAAGRGLPYDFFLPGLRGQDAIVLEPALSHVTLPTTQGTPAGQVFEGAIDIGTDGVAQVSLTLRFVSGAAAELRNAIQSVAPAERAQAIAERFVPSVVPAGAADPSTVRIEGLDDWEQPLAISFVATSAAMVQPARDGFHVMPLFASNLEGSFGRLEARTTTEAVGEIRTEVTLRVHGPGVLHAPAAGVLHGPNGAEATLSADVANDGSITLTRRVLVPLSLVPVAQYPELLDFCRRVTQLDQRTVVITPR